MKVLVAQTESAKRSAATLRALAASLERQGLSTGSIKLPATGLPPRVRQLDFKATPAEVVDSWRVARHLEDATAPGDVVLLSDRGAVGVVFTLDQAALPPDQRRWVLMAAADSTSLSGGHGIGSAYQGPLARWELAGYRAAAALLPTSEWAAALVEPLNDNVAMVVSGVPRKAPVVSNLPRNAWLPEPVSRIAQTGAILRALADNPSLRVAVADGDSADELWRGSTWSTLAGVRALFGDRLSRGSPKQAPDVVILGDRTAVPAPELSDLRDRDVRFVVPSGSTAAIMWPEVDVWETEDDLAAVMSRLPQGPRSHAPGSIEIARNDVRSTRARRVSAGVPVFRNVEYLDECVGSILDQTQPASEIILYDDGSQSEVVTAALNRWAEDHPEVIRVMSGPNRGVCVARNRILDAMEGDAFLLVDSDDKLAPTFIEECAEALRANPGWTAVATWTEFFGAYEGVEAKPPFDAGSAWDENPIISTCALVDMSIRDEGIRFAPDLAWIYCEDWEFWAKIVAAGGSFGLVPKPLAFHRAAPESGGGYLRTDLAYEVGRERARQHLRKVNR
jgi:GT2 family glycosyltransferase